MTGISPKYLPILLPPPMGVCNLGLAKFYYERERSSTTSPPYPAPAVTPLLHLRDPGHALKNDDHHPAALCLCGRRAVYLPQRRRSRTEAAPASNGEEDGCRMAFLSSVAATADGVKSRLPRAFLAGGVVERRSERRLAVLLSWAAAAVLSLAHRRGRDKREVRQNNYYRLELPSWESCPPL